MSDYRDILRRATELHVQVIPEIDMPGHMHAAIQSMRVRTAKLKSQGLSVMYACVEKDFRGRLTCSGPRTLLPRGRD